MVNKNNEKNSRWSYHYHLPKFTCTTKMTFYNVGGISATLGIITKNSRAHVTTNSNMFSEEPHPNKWDERVPHRKHEL